MPRYKTDDKGLKLVPVDLEKQVQPGSFKHALCHLVEFDLADFHKRSKNDSEPK